MTNVNTAERMRRWRMAHPDYHREPNRRYKISCRDRVRAIKLERGCVDCGYRDHHEALQFDHIGGGKIERVSVLVGQGRGWPAISAEIAKCEVVCANCHAVRTASRR